MSARMYLAVLGIAAAAFVLRPDAPAVIEAGPAPIENAPIVDGEDQTTTLDDQAELSLTVYNSDIALVRDVRNLQLPRGTGNLRFMDIAATDRKSTRLNSSHSQISYAVFCLKKKKQNAHTK